MATMADVAALAGVSTSTVSHVLNRTRAVDPSTRARVEQAIRTTGYRPNHVARSLATSSTRTVGLAMSMLGRDTYFAEFAQAIEMGARAAGYSLIYADTHDDPATEELVIAQFLSQQVDGMVWASTGSPAAALDAGLPTVLADRLRDLLDARTVDGPGLAEAGELLGAPPTRLVRCFTRRHGLPPHRYLTGRRLDRARRLLLDGMPAAQVAPAVGFYDQAHLTRHFRRLLATTPAAYARSGSVPG